MIRQLSTEWAGRGVRVNVILPAQVTNPGLQERMKADPNLEAIFLRGIPAGFLGVPDDIKGPAMWTGLRSGIRWLPQATLAG